jgi:major vault protein
VVGGLDKVVFLPSGSNLNLFDSMQGLLGPGGKNGATTDKGTGGAN